MKDWIVNEITGEIFHKKQLVLFLYNLVIDANDYDMCLQTAKGEFFENCGGHGEGYIIQNIPNDEFSDEHKTLCEQLGKYLNDYEYTLDEFLKLPQQ